MMAGGKRRKKKFIIYLERFGYVFNANKSSWPPLFGEDLIGKRKGKRAVEVVHFSHQGSIYQLDKTGIQYTDNTCNNLRHLLNTDTDREQLGVIAKNNHSLLKIG